jgi:hypothetical protein
MKIHSFLAILDELSYDVVEAALVGDWVQGQVLQLFRRQRSTESRQVPEPEGQAT